MPKRSPAVERCFPAATVAVDVSYATDDLAPPLSPHLRPHVAGAVASRRREFAFGRECALRAVAALGSGIDVIDRGPDRAPIWPKGIRGSISHVAGYAVAVAARLPPVEAIGIDVVEVGTITDDVACSAFTATESTRLPVREGLDRSLSLAVAFGAKEAIFKAQYQLTGSWVDFDDVEVARLTGPAVPGGTGGVELSARKDSAISEDVHWPVHGRWIAAGRLVVVGVTTSGTARRATLWSP